MRKRTKNYIMFWAMILCALLLGLAIESIRADGYYLSRDGWEGPVTFHPDIECDSAWSIYYFGSIAQDTVHLYPADSTDSTYLKGEGLALDSLGTYVIVTKYWPQGSLSVLYDSSKQEHEGPGRIVAASPSGSYICRIYGYLSDLGSNYVSGATVTAKSDKALVYDTCSGMLVVDKTEDYGPTGSGGYWEIELIRSSCIGGEKYVITVSKPHLPDVTRKVTIPDSTTYYYKWGN